MRQSMVVILRPDFRGSSDRAGKIRVFPRLEDYIEVPRLSTYGTYEVVEMLSMETLAQLSILRRSLSG